MCCFYCALEVHIGNNQATAFIEIYSSANYHDTAYNAFSGFLLNSHQDKVCVHVN